MGFVETSVWQMHVQDVSKTLNLGGAFRKPECSPSMPKSERE